MFNNRNENVRFVKVLVRPTLPFPNVRVARCQVQMKISHGRNVFGVKGRQLKGFRFATPRCYASLNE
jgi:hypothetical protein